MALEGPGLAEDVRGRHRELEGELCGEVHVRLAPDTIGTEEPWHGDQRLLY